MYRLELWNPAHATRLGILDAEDVRIVEALNNEHTLEFSLDFNDPARSLVSPRQIVRVVDESVTLETLVTSLSSFPPNPVYVQSSWGWTAGDYAWLSSNSRPYPTKITSVTSGIVYFSRILDTPHADMRLSKIGYDWFRVRSIEDSRDEEGLLMSQVQADHFSYDLADRLHTHNGRADFGYSVNAQAGEIVAPDASPTDVASHIFAHFAPSSFTLGTIEPTERKTITFSRENCFTSWRKLPETWALDTRVNRDYTADLLHFAGIHSHLQVRYQKNLHAIRKHTDASSLATVIYPVGANSGWDDAFSGVSASLTGSAHTRTKIYLTAGHGARFRYGDVILVWYNPVTGTATSGTITTLADTGAAWADNQHLGKMLLITAGTGAGQVREAKWNTGTAITPVEPFKVAPDNTSQYSISAFPPEITDIVSFGHDEGTADASSTIAALVDNTKAWTVDLYAGGGTVEILTGTGQGQVRYVGSNTATAIVPTVDFNPAPDDTSTYRLKAAPHKSDTLTVSKLDRIPTASDVIYLAMVEDGALVPGKDFNYRDTVVNYWTASDVATLQVNDVTRFAKARDIRVYETELGSMAIPVVRASHGRIIETYSGGYLQLAAPLATVPNSHAQVEVISFWDSAAASSWGELPSFFYANESRSPYQLAQDALVQLEERKRPKVRYTVRFGDLYEFNRTRYDADRVNVGDLFDVIDDAVTTSNETLTSGTVLTRADSGPILTIDTTPNPNWTYNQWRGKKIEARGQRRAVFTNNASQLVTEAFSTLPIAGDPFAILSALRVVKKEWNPFDPDALQVEVSNPSVLDFYDTLVDMTERTARASERAERGVSIGGSPRCLYWSPKQRRCQRQNYPNWFCQSDESNRDGRMTKHLKPITASDCSAWRPIESDRIGGADPIGVGGTVNNVTNSSYDGTHRFAVDVDVIVSIDSFAEVVGVIDEASPTSAIDVTTAEARIQIDAQGEVVPFNATTRKGCYVQVRRASGSASLKVRALAMIFGSDG